MTITLTHLFQPSALSALVTRDQNEMDSSRSCTVLGGLFLHIALLSYPPLLTTRTLCLDSGLTLIVCLGMPSAQMRIEHFLDKQTGLLQYMWKGKECHIIILKQGKCKAH